MNCGVMSFIDCLLWKWLRPLLGHRFKESLVTDWVLTLRAKAKRSPGIFLDLTPKHTFPIAYHQTVVYVVIWTS